MNVVTSPRLLLLALTLLCLLATAPGCKTDEQKYLESFLAMDEDVLQVLVDSAPDADKAVKALHDLDQATRSDRDKLRKKLKAALDELDTKEKEAFAEEAMKRHKEMGTRMDAAVKRYPLERQPELRRTIRPMTR